MRSALVKGHSDPAGQAVQLPWPLSENVPAAQAVAALDVHDDPAGQGMQVVADAPVAYRPVGHVMTMFTVVSGHMVPAAHAVHAVLVPSWYEPAAHRVKVGDACVPQLYPGGHGWLRSAVESGQLPCYPYPTPLL